MDGFCSVLSRPFLGVGSRRRAGNTEASSGKDTNPMILRPTLMTSFRFVYFLFPFIYLFIYLKKSFLKFNLVII